MRYEEAMKHCIFRFMSGSHAYGTNQEGSDEDFRGVFMAPLSKAFELFQTSFVGSGSLGDLLDGVRQDMRIGNINSAGEKLRLAMDVNQGDLNFSVGTVGHPTEDEELQELRKFLKLAAECNPNIIEFLWVDRGITHTSPIWEKIRAKRDMFLSKKARYTFSGYAIAQLKRIQTHRGYLLNPPAAKPTRADFGLPEETTVPQQHEGPILSLPEGFLNAETRANVVAERKYREAKEAWDSYADWKKNRNEKRQDLESRFGYDTKHAMHLVRLIRMAKEILTEKTVKVYRPDRVELLGIRNGSLPYDELVRMTENVDAELDALYKATDLRNKPDHKGIADLYMEVAEEYYGIKVR
jgi:hypothetical protein